MYTDDFEIRYDDEEIVEEDCLPECEESEEEESPEIGEDQEENEGGCDGEGIYEDILPYPPIENIQPNKLYAAIGKNLYSGMVSEMTASTQYFYNSCVLRNCYEEAYEAFKRIMIVEMHHMEMLSRVILALGGDVKFTYRTHTGENVWSVRFLRYSRTARQILLEAILAEENAIECYTDACEAIKDENVTCVLKRIIMDERKHLEVFKELYQKII